MNVQSLARKVSDHCRACAAPCPTGHGTRSANAAANFDAAMTCRRRVPAGAEICLQGEASKEFYMVAEGWLVLYKLLPDGSRQNVKIAMPGDVIAFSLNPDEAVYYTAKALTDAVLCVGDRAGARRHFGRDPELLRQVVDYLVRDEALAREQLTSVARTSALERVAHLVCELFQRQHGRAPERGEAMAWPLTQEQMGDAIGLSAIHVNRMLSQLRSAKVIATTRGQLRVLDPDRLIDLAQFDAELDVGDFAPPPAFDRVRAVGAY